MSGWQAEAGGLIDNFDLLVREAFFGPDAEYAEGKIPVFTLRGRAVQEGVVVDDNHKMLLTIGDGWTVEAGGARITHPKRQVPNELTGMGALIDSLAAVWGNYGEQLASQGKMPTEAAVWVGFHFRVERKFETVGGRKFINQNTGEPQDKPLATAWHGVGDNAAPTAAPAAAAPPAPAAPAAAPAPPPAAPTAAQNGDLEGALLEWARQFDWTQSNFETFASLATSSEEGSFPRSSEVIADEAVQQKVLDQTYWNQLVS